MGNSGEDRLPALKSTVGVFMSQKPMRVWPYTLIAWALLAGLVVAMTQI